nr:ead/Ea22-like family protein [Escherichia coli]
MSKIDYQALREAAEAIKVVATPKKLLAFRMNVTPQVVLALLDERERNQQYIKRRDQENEDIALTVGRLRVELEAAENNLIDSECRVAELEEALCDKQALLEAAEKRIAELSASHRKLRNTMAGIHNTIRVDGGYTPLAAILNAAKRAYEESASAAGIRIKGE